MGRNSDRKTAVLPRYFKRQLSLNSTGNIHEDGEIRRLMIKAHKYSLEVENRRTKLESDSIDEVAEESTPTIK